MALKVFCLDPPTDAAEGFGGDGFLRLAVEQAGWNISRPARLEMGTDVTRWLGDLRRGLEEADIIISLGTFTVLIQSGSELPSMLELMRRRIDDGCPALFDGISGLLARAFPGPEKQIQEFFQSYGIHLTSTKVASEIAEFPAHRSDLCCVFRAADDALLDGRLFNGVDETYAYGNYLIQYEPEVYPLIETGGLHFFVNEGDLRTFGNLGQRNAVAVRRYRNKQYLVVSSGSYFRDRAQTLGGMLPGIEDNRKLATNIISELSESVRHVANSSAQSFELFRELEACLGELIQKALTRTSGERFFDLLPEKMKEKLRMADGRVDYSRATFIDLILVLRELWASHFEPCFASETMPRFESDAILKPLFAINEQRKYLAHPHKARVLGWQPAPGDVQLMQDTLVLIRSALRRAGAN